MPDATTVPLSFGPANPAHSLDVDALRTALRGLRALTPIRLGMEGRTPDNGALLLDREDLQILAQLLSNVRIEGKTAADHSQGLRRLAIWARAMGSL